MSPRLKQGVIQLLKVLIAIGLIWWVVSQGQLKKSDIEHFLQPQVLLVGLSLMSMMLFVNIYRWHILLRIQGLSISFLESIQLSYLGLFFNYALPGGVGGDFVKGYYLFKKYPNLKLEGAATVFLDRLVGLAMMSWMALVALFIRSGQEQLLPEVKVLVFAVQGLSILFLAMLMFGLFWPMQAKFSQAILAAWPRAARLQNRMQNIVEALRRHRLQFILTFILSMFSQSLFVCFLYLVSMQLGFTDISWGAYFFLAPLGIVAMTLPISLAGMGVGQVAFSYLFTIYISVEAGRAATVGITTFQIAQFICSLWGGYLYLRPQSRKQLGELK